MQCEFDYGVNNYDDIHVNADTCIDGGADDADANMMVLMMVVVLLMMVVLMILTGTKLGS